MIEVQSPHPTRAEIDRDALETVAEIVRDAFTLFDHYGDLHAAKPDEIKAKRNYEAAAAMKKAFLILEAALSTSPPVVENDQGAGVRDAALDAINRLDDGWVYTLGKYSRHTDIKTIRNALRTRGQAHE